MTLKGGALVAPPPVAIRVIVAVEIMLTGMASTLAAQSQPSAPSYVQPEGRADVIIAHTAAIELAGGAVAPVGESLRLGGDLGGGVAGGPDHSVRATGRINAYGRFQLDPYAEERWALYLVGGGSYRVTGGERGAVYILVAVGVEGPPAGGLVPAFEAGFGGGVRVGFALRRALPHRR